VLLSTTRLVPITLSQKSNKVETKNMFPNTRRIVIIALLLGSTIECSASKLRGFPKRHASRALAKGEDKAAITSEEVITQQVEDTQIEENNEEEELSSIDPVVESTGKGAAASEPVVTPVEESAVEETNEEEELSSIDPVVESTGKGAAASEPVVTPVEEPAVEEELLYASENIEEIAAENDEEEEELSSIDPVVDSKGKEKAGKETVIKSVSDSKDVFNGKAAKGVNAKLQNQTDPVGKQSGPENKGALLMEEPHFFASKSHMGKSLII